MDITRLKCHGCLLGTAVGDAYGIAYEFLSREEIKHIRKQQNLPDSYTQKIPIKDDLYYSSLPDTHPLIPDQMKLEGITSFELGRWTDDTQLSISLVLGLVNSGENPDSDKLMESISKEFVVASIETSIGWGTGTHDAALRLAQHPQIYTWKSSGNSTSVGDGVVMKLAPLALFIYCSTVSSAEPSLPYGVQSSSVHDAYTQQCRWWGSSIATMTHDNALCKATASFQLRMIVYILTRTQKNTKYFDSMVYRVDLMHTAIKFAFEEEVYFINTDHELSNRFKKFIKELVLKREISEASLIKVSNGASFNVLDALTMVWGLLFTDGFYMETILRGALIGGDTDTVAAMIGGIVGLVKGEEEIDTNLVQTLWKRDHIISVANTYVNWLGVFLNQLDISS